MSQIVFDFDDFVGWKSNIFFLKFSFQLKAVNDDEKNDFDFSSDYEIHVTHAGDFYRL